MTDCPICDGDPYEYAPDVPGFLCYQIPGTIHPAVNLEYGFHRPTHLLLWEDATLPPDGPHGPTLLPLEYKPLSSWQVPGTWYRFTGWTTPDEGRRAHRARERAHGKSPYPWAMPERRILDDIAAAAEETP